MDAVRRGAGVFLKFFVPLLVLLVLVQVFLAGWGVFGIEDGQGLEEATTLDLHRGVGFFVTFFGSILLLLGTLLWWPRDKRLLGVGIVAAVLLFAQLLFAGIGGQFLGAIHALNALILLTLLGFLASSFWRGARGAPGEVPPR
jgi:hypothetical protein